MHLIVMDYNHRVQLAEEKYRFRLPVAKVPLDLHRPDG